MKNLNVSEKFKNSVKRGTCFVLSTALSCTLIGGVNAVNDDVKESNEQVSLFALTPTTLNVSTGVNIYINDKSFTPTDANGNEVYPFLLYGTVYLPARAISNVFGSEISWNSSTSTVILNTKNININNTSQPRKDTPLVNSTLIASTGVKMIVNGKSFIPTDVAGNIVNIYIVNGTTYLPVRAISNLYNVDIVWEGSNKAAYIGKHVKNEYNTTYQYSNNIDKNYTEAINRYAKYYHLLKVHDSEINERKIAVIDSQSYTEELFESVDINYDRETLIKYAEPELDALMDVTAGTMKLRNKFLHYELYMTRMVVIEGLYKDAVEGKGKFQNYETIEMQSWADSLEDLYNNYDRHISELSDSILRQRESEYIAALNKLKAKLADAPVSSFAYTLQK